MSRYKTLTIKPVTSVSPEKIKRSEDIGFRFIDRKGRYLLQKKIVRYEIVDAHLLPTDDYTWVDVPLVPEVYA